MSQTWERFQQREAELSTTLQENLTGVRVVKAFARQVFEMDKFEENNMAQFKAGRGLVMMHAFFWPSTDILCAAQMLTGFFIGALMAINGEITVGTYLAYAGLVVWVIWPLRNLGRIIVQTSTGLVSFGRVLEILKQDREPVDEGTYLPEGDVRGEIVFDVKLKGAVIESCAVYSDAMNTDLVENLKGAFDGVKFDREALIDALEKRNTIDALKESMNEVKEWVGTLPI